MTGIGWKLGFTPSVFTSDNFSKSAKGEAPCHKIWEDEKHLAFLSTHANTEGFSVVITKAHHSSYAFNLEDDVLSEHS